MIVSGLCSLGLVDIWTGLLVAEVDSTVSSVLTRSVDATLRESGARVRVSFDAFPGHYDQGEGK